MLNCQKCGYDNELGRIFCHQCGAKLDLDAIKPVSRGGKALRPKGRHSMLKWIRRIVELMILGVLLFAVYLMLQAPAAPAKPGETDAAAADKKWLALEKLVNGRKASHLEISPAEAKAFLAGLTFEKSDMKWGFVPERVWIEFKPGFVELHILATMRLGGSLEKKVYLRYTGVPKIQDGRFVFEPKEGRVGQLNWPLDVVKALGFHQRIFSEVFVRLTTERDVLSQLDRIEARADRVIVYYQPR
jgi:hypothetical protein